MPALRHDVRVDLDGYDRLCAAAEDGERLEYIDGQVFRMMVGGSTAHHALTRRLDGLVAARLAPDGPCASFRETMRLEAGTARFYPDVFVACGDGVVADPDTKGVAGATVILEVLSPSTERYDRGRKWLAYQGLPDLRHFVLVAQDQRRIEAYHREGAGWRYELLQAPDAVLRLDAIAVALRLDEIYAVVPTLAVESEPRPPSAVFAPAQVARIAGLKGLAVSPGIEALLAKLDAEECAAAVAVLVGMAACAGTEQWRMILPKRLHYRLDAALNQTT
ncbi:Endonuclease, Uma2 family (restriction endonuclease fold) [Methylobacterium sp. 174MFSha1.1]|uniref:Uma2 family endonuclease n=1 Tax=Methylobacterium sp. 174MFSha1.1 TaxID=1502749 RepID=UPI0008E59A95|nr:Uma2 family endonuclease [Methylobacterium sp. 174MFSha1.1]SFV14247.1 Endonuclease, Uma2 family (restriction endonuclease fold) [Methylobacterium sp. 174MFSha1.1]